MEQFRQQLAGRGASPAFIKGYADMMNAKDNGLDEGVARTEENTTPTTFRQWCEEKLKPAVAKIS